MSEERIVIRQRKEAEFLNEKDMLLQQSSQPDGTRLTAEEIAAATHDPTPQEVMAHFPQDALTGYGLRS